MNIFDVQLLGTNIFTVINLIAIMCFCVWKFRKTRFVIEFSLTITILSVLLYEQVWQMLFHGFIWNYWNDLISFMPLFLSSLCLFLTLFIRKHIKVTKIPIILSIVFVGITIFQYFSGLRLVQTYYVLWNIAKTSCLWIIPLTIRYNPPEHKWSKNIVIQTLILWTIILYLMVPFGINPIFIYFSYFPYAYLIYTAIKYAFNRR